VRLLAHRRPQAVQTRAFPIGQALRGLGRRFRERDRVRTLAPLAMAACSSIQSPMHWALENRQIGRRLLSSEGYGVDIVLIIVGRGPPVFAVGAKAFNLFSPHLDHAAATQYVKSVSWR